MAYSALIASKKYAEQGALQDFRQKSIEFNGQGTDYSKELVNIATSAYKERIRQNKIRADAARQIEYERRCNIANGLYCKLPAQMLEAAEQEKFAVIINCGDGPVGETVANLDVP